MSSADAETNCLETSIQQAADFIQAKWERSPRYGIVLGTGAGDLAKSIEVHQTIPYPDVPGFPASTALGHKGQFVCGMFADQDVIAMEGRFHLYEGYSVDLATLPIHVMHRLGVEILFVSNASGGISPKLCSGQIMAIDSHVDFMFRSTIAMNARVAQQRPSVRSDQAYDRGLIELARQSARQNGFPLHQGVYASMLGPNYETRAEYRFLRRIGADVAGMSTVPEVAVAAARGIKVLGLSVVTNVAKPDVLESTSGQEVIDAAVNAAPNLTTIVADVIRATSDQHS
jgi:purine-nucleoside phosphorylase